MKTRRQMFSRAVVAVMAALITLTGLAMAAPAASAATMRTWTGGGTTNNWTDAANWGGAAPVAGDNLVFPAGAARRTNTNNFVAGTTFGSIRFTGNGATYTLGGNQVALGGGGLSTADGSAPDVVTVALPIKLTITQTFAMGSFTGGAGQFTYSGGIDLGGRNLTFYAPVGTHRIIGPLSGTGSIATGGGGTSACRVIFAGTNTSTGITNVNSGCTTFVNGDYSARTTYVNSSGQLAGKGTFGALTAVAVGAGVESASDTGPTSILTVKGALSLGAGSNYFATINSTTPAPATASWWPSRPCRCARLLSSTGPCTRWWDRRSRSFPTRGGRRSQAPSTPCPRGRRSSRAQARPTASPTRAVSAGATWC